MDIAVTILIPELLSTEERILMSKKIIQKHILIPIVKTLLAAALIVFLIKSDSLDFRSLTLVFQHLNLFIPALFCLFLGIVIGGVRWWLLLRASGNNIPLGTVLSLQLMGSFFSTWLPGAAGGDAVRAIQIFRLLDHGRSAALLSIIIDRVFATLGLIFIAVIALLLLPDALVYNAALKSYINLLENISWAIGFFAIVISLMIWLTLRFSLLAYMPIMIRNYLKPIEVTILRYTNAWPILVLCMGVSMLASSIVVIGILLISEIFTYAASPFVTAIAGVLGNVFSAIPITPGGIGVGESVFSKICTDLSARAAPFATIYFTFRVGMLIVNIPGMLISLLYNRVKHQNIIRTKIEA